MPAGEAGDEGVLACPPDVAHWLHDEIVQRLCSVVAALGSEQLQGADRVRCRVELEAALGALRSLLTDGVARVRERRYRSVAEAVQASCDAPVGCSVHLRLTGDAEVSPEAGQLVADFVTEALRNIVKHADAQLIVVTVTLENDAVHIDAFNDGVCTAPGSVGAGVGLRLLATRALHHGGIVSAHAASPDGWSTRLTLTRRSRGPPVLHSMNGTYR